MDSTAEIEMRLLRIGALASAGGERSQLIAEVRQLLEEGERATSRAETGGRPDPAEGPSPGDADAPAPSPTVRDDGPDDLDPALGLDGNHARRASAEGGIKMA